MAFTSLTRNEIIRYALLKCGVEYDDLSADQVQYISDNLNSLVNAWQDEHIYIWQTTRTTQALTASTSTYTMAAGTLDIQRAFIRDGNDDCPVKIIGAQEFADLPDKTDEARIPYYLWFDKKATPVVNLYPTPNSTTPVLHMDLDINITESDDNATALDFNKPKYTALIWNLAREVALDFGIVDQRYNIISSRAEHYKRVLFQSSSETTSDDIVKGAYDDDNY
jgi:hypothetical protein